MTVGVVGVGNIGNAVIRRLHGFGCRVLASNNSRTTTAAADLVSLDELLRESDVVTLHLPLNADTHHLIGREQIADDEAGRVPRQHRARGAGGHRRADRGAGARKAGRRGVGRAGG